MKKNVPFLILSFLFVLAPSITTAQNISGQIRTEVTQIIANDKIKIPNHPVDSVKSTTNSIGQRNPIEDLTKENSSYRNGEDILISDNPEAESEVHAAINPTDPKNIIIASMKVADCDPLTDACTVTFPIYYTKNFGQTWKVSAFDGIPPAANSNGGGDPVLLFDQDGKAHLFWLLFEIDPILGLSGTSKMMWATSENKGETWQIQDPIDESTYQILIIFITGDFLDKEWATIDLSTASPHEGNVYFVYTNIQADIGSEEYQVWFKRKRAGENTFDDKIILAADDFGFVHFPSITVDRDGNVHVIFYAQLPGEDIFSLYHRRSIDGGFSFSNPVKIADAHIPCWPPSPLAQECITGIGLNRLYPCNHIRADQSNGLFSNNLYVTWTADGQITQETDGVDIYFSKSSDGGNTWSPAQIINDDASANPNTHNFFSSMAVNENGHLALAWYDRREDPNNLLTHYYSTTSTDGGETFKDNFCISSLPTNFSTVGDQNGGFGVGEYNHIITNDSFAISIWGDGRGDDGNIDLYMAITAFDDVVTGVQEFGLISPYFGISDIFPNPADEDLVFTITLTEESKIGLQIFDAIGKLKKPSVPASYPSGEHKIQLDISDLPSGTYFLKIESKFGFRNKSFIKK